MSRVNELKQFVAQNEAEARAVAHAALRDFVENRKVELQDVADALGVLGISPKTLETAVKLHEEMVALTAR